MSYKIYIYALVIFAVTFVLSGINFNPIFRKGKINESKIFIILLVMALSYLVANFVFDFIEIT